MFQIFAARMFEQRVLTAYREKVAQERQKKLLEELEEETRLDVQREQKRAKEAQKKKDKKRLQKQAKDEEKARKDAERAAEEAAARAVEEKKAEELRLKKDEQRKKKEAERKAQDEERLKREAEKQRRLQDERERQAEQERKHRELKEREKKRKEETRKKEREEREAREKEVREKKEREDQERREREAQAKVEIQAKERARREELAAQQSAAAAASSAAMAQAAAQAAQASQVASQFSKRSAPIPSLPIPPGLPPLQHLKTVKSPHLQVATPAVPKAAVPVRAPPSSQHGSGSSSPKTPQVLAKKGPSASPSTASQHSSPGPVGGPRKVSLPQAQYYPPPPSTMAATAASPTGLPLTSASGFPFMPLSGVNDAMTSLPTTFPTLTQRASFSHDGLMYGQSQPPVTSQYRGFPPMSVPSVPQALSTMRSGPVGRGFSVDSTAGLPPFNTQLQIGVPPAQTYSNNSNNNSKAKDTMPTHSHSRQQSVDSSLNLESLNLPSSSGPMSKPAPIQRPSSMTRHQANGSRDRITLEIDDLSNHLGSSALLDNNDETLTSDVSRSRRSSAAPIQSGPRQGRSRYPYTSMYPPSVNRTFALLFLVDERSMKQFSTLLTYGL